MPLRSCQDTKLLPGPGTTGAVGKKISYAAGSSLTAAFPTAAELAALHHIKGLCPTALHVLLFSACIDPTDMGFIFLPDRNHTSGATHLAKTTVPTAPGLGI